ncbi:hypothetical protein AB0H00_12450 [Nocardia sp. NPDC023852]|uniref:hypothetical protein n=1 Tax=Nocardia sp. NPDC023852 TaxID=3154697 RepID=UPI0033EC53B3
MAQRREPIHEGGEHVAHLYAGQLSADALMDAAAHPDDRSRWANRRCRSSNSAGFRLTVTAGKEKGKESTYSACVGVPLETRARATAVAGTIRTDWARVAAKLLLDTLSRKEPPMSA